jgi:anti-sigma B factor antagonist
MDDVEPLRVVCTSAGSDTIVSITGELDMDSVDTLRHAIAHVSTSNGGRLIFDLAAVEFIDSSGLAALLESRRGGTQVRVRHLSPAVERLIAATGLSSVIEVVPE